MFSSSLFGCGTRAVIIMIIMMTTMTTMMMTLMLKILCLVSAPRSVFFFGAVWGLPTLHDAPSTTSAGFRQRKYIFCVISYLFLFFSVNFYRNCVQHQRHLRWDPINHLLWMTMMMTMTMMTMMMTMMTMMMIGIQLIIFFERWPSLNDAILNENKKFRGGGTISTLGFKQGGWAGSRKFQKKKTPKKGRIKTKKLIAIDNWQY